MKDTIFSSPKQVLLGRARSGSVQCLDLRSALLLLVTSSRRSDALLYLNDLLVQCVHSFRLLNMPYFVIPCSTSSTLSSDGKHEEVLFIRFSLSVENGRAGAGGRDG